MINKTKYIFSIFPKFKNSKTTLVFKKLFKSISFLKYPILIFLISITIYLIVPKYLNYDKKESAIKMAFDEKYGINLKEINSITYNFFPRPRLKLEVPSFSINGNLINGKIKSLYIILNYSELYNIKNLQLNKIILDNSNLNFEINKYKDVFKYLKNYKDKILIKNSFLIFKDQNKELTKISKVKIQNTNKKISARGYLLEKKIYLDILDTDDSTKIDLKIPEIASFMTISLDTKNNHPNILGEVKTKILNNNLEFEFKYKNKFKIYNSLFRNRNLQSSFDGEIELKPYFKFDLVFNLINVNFDKLIDINFIKKVDKILLNNKKLNGRLEALYENKSFYFHTIKKSDILLFFNNGEIDIKNISIKTEDGIFNFSGFVSGSDYQKLDFKTFIDVENKGKFLRRIGVDKKHRGESVNLTLEGSINLSANKIYLEEITSKNGYSASKEDIKYYKKNFEELVIKDSYLGLFDKKKIKDFIQKIY